MARSALHAILATLAAMIWTGNVVAGLVREANTTLTLPPNPPTFGFVAPDAFGPLRFSQPVAMVAPPGETNRLFIVEKLGRIQVLTNLAAPTRTLFLDLSARVNPSGEGGLLGLAFHPGYHTNRQFFVFYTLNTSSPAGTGFHNRLARFQTDPENPHRALPGSEVPLLTQYDQADNHNGGDLHFGPDGYLYVALGDEGGGGDQFNNSRFVDRDFFAGILRLDVDERPENLPPNPHPAVNGHYRVPHDNPWVGATEFLGRPVNPHAVRTEFWATGLRNPWRFSFDPATGLLYCGDVGQNAREEVHIVEGGGHHGWNYREGFLPYRGTPPPGVTFIEPILDYPRSGNAAFIGRSITGGVVYRGDRLSQLFGHYVFGDYASGNIWALRFDGAEVSQFRRLTGGNGIVAFGIDPTTQDVLFAEIGSGRIRRLGYTDTPVGPPLPPTLAETGAFVDVASLTPNPGIVPYAVNVSFWSDHAQKQRWFSVPRIEDTLRFHPTDGWEAPSGTIWIKHFELELERGNPASRRRLETRFLVRNPSGVYGITYRWNDEQTNATLVPEEGLDEEITIQTAEGLKTQVWHYPSRSECLQCHTPAGGLALSFNTPQLNRDLDHGDGATNQIMALAAAGYLENPPENPHVLSALVPEDRLDASLEYRVRSYLAANCAACHQPGAPGLGRWDARFATSTAQAGLIDGLLVNTAETPDARIVTAGDPSRSALLQRILLEGPGRMPPIASSEPDLAAIALLTEWIGEELGQTETFADWQRRHFQSTTDPLALATADGDEDEASNELEFLTRTDPHDETDFWLVSVVRDGFGVRIEIPQPANRGFEVQWTPRLDDSASWQSLNAPGNAPFFPSAARLQRVLDPDADGAERYYRVRVFAP